MHVATVRYTVFVRVGADWRRLVPLLVQGTGFSRLAKVDALWFSLVRIDAGWCRLVHNMPMHNKCMGWTNIDIRK